MSKLGTLRRSGEKRARLVFAMFAAVWLNLLLQPCTFAATKADSSDPTATIIEASHVHADRGDQDDAWQSVAAVSDCCCSMAGIQDDAEASKRIPTSESKDARSDLCAGVSATWAAHETVYFPSLSGHPLNVDPPPADRPINIRNCVYLI